LDQSLEVSWEDEYDGATSLAMSWLELYELPPRALDSWVPEPRALEASELEPRPDPEDRSEYLDDEPM